MKRQIIFSDEYERKERIRRWFKRSVFFVGAGTILIFLTCLFIIYSSTEENALTKEHFFKREPDVIVVFTGDMGRIPLALELAATFQAAKLFITGVHSKNTITSLLNQKGLESIKEGVDSNQIEIDYLAGNTVENVISTFSFLRENTGMKEVLLISHDYHIVRIKSIVNTLKLPNDHFIFYYHGLKTDYKQWRNLKIIIKEVFKILRAKLFLLLFE